MEPALAQLESLFQKADADLSYVSRKLHTEFASVYAERGLDKVTRRRLVQAKAILIDYLLKPCSLLLVWYVLIFGSPIWHCLCVCFYLAESDESYRAR